MAGRTLCSVFLLLASCLSLDSRRWLKEKDHHGPELVLDLDEITGQSAIGRLMEEGLLTEISLCSSDVFPELARYEGVFDRVGCLGGERSTPSKNAAWRNATGCFKFRGILGMAFTVSRFTPRKSYLHMFELDHGLVKVELPLVLNTSLGRFSVWPSPMPRDRYFVCLVNRLHNINNCFFAGDPPCNESGFIKERTTADQVVRSGRKVTLDYKPVIMLSRSLLFVDENFVSNKYEELLLELIQSGSGLIDSRFGGRVRTP